MLTDTQVSKISKAFANGSLTNINFSKSQFLEMVQSKRLFVMFNAINPINPIKVLSKIGNKAVDLSKKVSLRDIIETVKISKNFIKDFKKFSGTRITLTKMK